MAWRRQFNELMMYVSRFYLLETSENASYESFMRHVSELGKPEVFYGMEDFLGRIALGDVLHMLNYRREMVEHLFVKGLSEDDLDYLWAHRNDDGLVSQDAPKAIRPSRVSIHSSWNQHYSLSSKLGREEITELYEALDASKTIDRGSVTLNDLIDFFSGRLRKVIIIYNLQAFVYLLHTMADKGYIIHSYQDETEKCGFIYGPAKKGISVPLKAVNMSSALNYFNKKVLKQTTEPKSYWWREMNIRLETVKKMMRSRGFV